MTRKVMPKMNDQKLKVIHKKDEVGVGRSSNPLGQIQKLQIVSLANS